MRYVQLVKSMSIKRTPYCLILTHTDSHSLIHAHSLTHIDSLKLTKPPVLSVEKLADQMTTEQSTNKLTARMQKRINVLQAFQPFSRKFGKVWRRIPVMQCKQMTLKGKDKVGRLDGWMVKWLDGWMDQISRKVLYSEVIIKVGNLGVTASVLVRQWHPYHE